MWDKDLLTRDDLLCSASWHVALAPPALQPQQPAAAAHATQAMQPLLAHAVQRLQQQAAAAAAAAAPPPRGSLQLQLALQRARGQERAGQMLLEVQWQPSEGPGPIRMLGPVRFRQQLSPLSGALVVWLLQGGHG